MNNPSKVYEIVVGAERHWVEVTVSLKAGVAGPAGTTYLNCRCVSGKRYWEMLKSSGQSEPCDGMSELSEQLGIDV